MPVDVTEIARSYLARVEKLFNESKLDEFVDLYTHDAKMMIPAKPIVIGRQAIRDHCQKSLEMYCGGTNVHKIELEEALDLGDDFILVRAKNDYFIGDKLVHVSKSVDILKKVDEKWLSYIFICNGNQ